MQLSSGFSITETWALRSLHLIYERLQLGARAIDATLTCIKSMYDRAR
jgi:hypothetical protein